MPDTWPKVVATDMDGTLLRTDGSLSERTRAAIAAVEDAGVAVVFVTARPPRRLDAFADVIGAHGIALCANGAFVYDVARRMVIERTTIDRATLESVVADLRAAMPQIVFAVERADGMSREDGFVSTIWGKEGDVADRLTDLASMPVGKLLGRCDELDPTDFHDRVATVLGGRAELGYSGAVGLAEITAKGVTKASGLARWCSEHAVDASEVWAFGDMPNDLPMLGWVGRAHAVANAHPEVLAVADEVVPANDDDGVAYALERITAGES
ncbi:HAD family hydrolase [Solicola gregarius]|uniref:Cof-type HAD-IIB family hydrolase n=1 Tax=Solicola gregarius TaxID=2908642 RepID=A0AA46TG21_9ACTN|nr:HAD family hydrolase [Solicola gregarius]UYM04431.1 Cof-type HAD-IIB family hydrolase [Solicola gregarius]